MTESGADAWFDTRTWTIVAALMAAFGGYALGKVGHFRAWSRSRRRPGPRA